MKNTDAGTISIGLTQFNPNTRSGCLPGYGSDAAMGIGYDSYHGGIFYKSIRPVEVAEEYSTGDTVGCFMCREHINDKEMIMVQFTLNGKKLLSPRLIPNYDWYPTIGIRSPGASIDTNFGENQFLFDAKGTNLF